MAEDEVPRAKRLKLLREAKLRKEREEKGEVPAPLGDDGPAASPQSPQESKELGEQGDDEPSPVEDSAIVEKPASDAEDEDEAMELAPKRANWDIERDIAPMLKKLEKRTQHTIVEILRTWWWWWWCTIRNVFCMNLISTFCTVLLQARRLPLSNRKKRKTRRRRPAMTTRRRTKRSRTRAGPTDAVLTTHGSRESGAVVGGRALLYSERDTQLVALSSCPSCASWPSSCRPSRPCASSSCRPSRHSCPSSSSCPSCPRHGTS